MTVVKKEVLECRKQNNKVLTMEIVKKKTQKTSYVPARTSHFITVFS